MTLQEVAQRAGVSTATVSRVLNNASVVKEETRKRVLKAVAELKYHPNLHAQTLAGGKSTALGMIVSNIQNPFFLDIYYGLEAVAHQAGYRVVLENTDYRASRLVASVRAMLGRRLAGLAVVVSEMEPSLVEELSSQNLPIVFYDVGHVEKNISRIKVRYDKGMERTVEYLYSLGHRKMAFVGHTRRPQPAWGTPPDIHQGHEEACRALSTWPSPVPTGRKVDAWPPSNCSTAVSNRRRSSA